MLYSEAVNDPTTNLGRMSVATLDAFKQRQARAERLVVDEGITLEEAFARVMDEYLAAVRR